MVDAGDELTVKPLGRLSVSAVLVNAKLFELLSVTVNVAAPFCAMLVGENASATVGGWGTVTVNAALDVAVLPPPGPVPSAAAGMVLVKVPAVPLETDTVTVQLDFGGMSPPLSVMTPEAA